MGWAIGHDPDRPGRFIGYGVPATCDHPGCGASIDRGMAYACGGGVTSVTENCGLFFCGEHLTAFEPDDEGGGDWVCERCARGEAPFEPTPDVEEWVTWLLTDESWEKWRRENPERVREMSER